LVPDWLALPLAGAIAAVAIVVALRWDSQLVAALGLLGAGLAHVVAHRLRDARLQAMGIAYAIFATVSALVGVAVGAPRLCACSRGRRRCGCRC
ncbi:MAG: hypothetical protein H0U05_12735, partial [Actinobacteria bacterium]|nr:hypothetical protein [Actinomycetota bacterium]